MKRKELRLKLLICSTAKGRYMVSDGTQDVLHLPGNIEMKILNRKLASLQSHSKL